MPRPHSPSHGSNGDAISAPRFGCSLDPRELAIGELGRLVEDRRSDLELSDVVQQRAPPQPVTVRARQAQLLGEQIAVEADPLGVAAGLAVVVTERRDQGEDLLRRDLRGVVVAAREPAQLLPVVPAARAMRSRDGAWSGNSIVSRSNEASGSSRRAARSTANATTSATTASAASHRFRVAGSVRARRGTCTSRTALLATNGASRIATRNSRGRDRLRLPAVAGRRGRAGRAGDCDVLAVNRCPLPHSPFAGTRAELIGRKRRSACSVRSSSRRRWSRAVGSIRDPLPQIGQRLDGSAWSISRASRWPSKIASLIGRGATASPIRYTCSIPADRSRSGSADQLAVERVVETLLGHHHDAVGRQRPRLVELVETASTVSHVDRVERHAHGARGLPSSCRCRRKRSPSSVASDSGETTGKVVTRSTL